MALIETESLILKSYPIAEADKIVVFLTRHHGLIKGVAKGAKRLKSRFGGSLEPFSIVNLTYFQKEERELVSISSLDIQKSFFSEAARPEFLQKFAYLTELLIEFSPPNEPNESLFRMACICLETAVDEPLYLDNIALYFELWILRLAGYLPDWKICHHCQNEIKINEKASLQINFHLLCLNCQRGSSKLLLSPIEKEIFLVAQTKNPINFIEFTNRKSSEVKEISNILKRIISHVLGKETVGQRIILASSING